ncbi:unnamed protein product [Orchesella dallaii]|uniref:Gustatory receptor n=1 Tax=Orchesella dallaii TaxID=48710 RepID=A0ABP1RYW1_9HEXA
MLIYENFLKFVSLQLRLQSIFGLSPFSLESNPIPKVVLCSKNRVTQLWLKLLFLTITVFILWIQIAESKNEQLATSLQSIFFANTFVSMLIQCGIILWKRENVALLFNLFLQFEYCNLPHWKSLNAMKRHEKLAMKTLFLITYFCPPIGALFYCLHKWFLPCTSATVGWKHLPECSGNMTQMQVAWSTESMTYLLLLNIFTFWLVVDIIGRLCSQDSVFVFLECCGLTQYLRYLRNVLVLECETNNLFSSSSKILVYRQLQILTHFYNVILQNYQIAYLQLALPAIIICSFAVIGEANNLLAVQLLFFAYVAFSSVVAIVVVVSVLACAHTESTISLDFMREQLVPKCGRKTRKLLEKYVVSFPVLKVNIGEVNFVEKTTLIEMLKFCVDQTTSLLLMR